MVQRKDESKKPVCSRSLVSEYRGGGGSHKKSRDRWEDHPRQRRARRLAMQTHARDRWQGMMGAASTHVRITRREVSVFVFASPWMLMHLA